MRGIGIARIGTGIGGVFVVVIGLAFLGLFVWSIVWAYGDAERRGKSGCLVALLVMFLTWPMGLVAWLVFRPNDTMRRQ